MRFLWKNQVYFDWERAPLLQLFAYYFPQMRCCMSLLMAYELSILSKTRYDLNENSHLPAIFWYLNFLQILN